MDTVARGWKFFALVNGLPGIVAGTLLLLVPSWAIGGFAWSIPARPSAVYVGASFLFRALMFWFIFRETSWRRMRYFVWGNVAFAGALLSATFLHADRFNWGSPTAYIWLFLYIEEPLWMIFLLAQSPPLRSDGDAEPERPALKGWLAVEAFFLVGLAGFFYFAPEFTNSLWSWTLTPLTARVMAGWPALFAAWAVTIALLKRWEEMRVGLLLNIFWLAILLVTLPLALSEIDTSRLAFWFYVGWLVLFLVALSILYFREARAAQGTAALARPAEGA